MRLGSIRIVLTRLTEPEEIGSVCRAMKSMGITNLGIVGDAEFDFETARIVAVHAKDVLDGSKRYSTVAEAASGCTLVAGVTANCEIRNRPRIGPREFAERVELLPEGKVAIVFGEEADECDMAVGIPLVPGRINRRVSHAVQIICYEIFSRLRVDNGSRTYLPVEGEALDELVDSIASSLVASGAVVRDVEQLRRVLGRAALSSSESLRLNALFFKLAGMTQSRGPETR